MGLLSREELGDGTAFFHFLFNGTGQRGLKDVKNRSCCFGGSAACLYCSDDVLTIFKAFGSLIASEFLFAHTTR